MSNLDRRIARVELAMEGAEIKDIGRMTRQEREQTMIEILTPHCGEEAARKHVHRLRIDLAYAEEVRRILSEVAEQAGIDPWR
jgi:hypothetical protein